MTRAGRGFPNFRSSTSATPRNLPVDGSQSWARISAATSAAASRVSLREHQRWRRLSHCPAHGQSLLHCCQSDPTCIRQGALLTAYSQGFGLAGLATFGRLAQQGIKRGAVLLRRRMLVELEITKNDDAYPWLLQWMYHRGHALGSEAAAETSRCVAVLPTAAD